MRKTSCMKILIALMALMALAGCNSSAGTTGATGATGATGPAGTGTAVVPTFPLPTGPAVAATGSATAALGPISGGTVTVTDLQGNVLGTGTTVAYSAARDTGTFLDALGATVRYLLPRAAGMVGDTGTVSITTSLANTDLVVITVTGGTDIDANDDGIIGINEGAATVAPLLQGEIRAVATLGDFKAGNVTLNALSTIAYGAVRFELTTSSPTVIKSHLTRIASVYLKASTFGDTNADGVNDFKDLYNFNPTKHVKTGTTITRLDDKYLSAVTNYTNLLPDTDALTTTFIEALFSGGVGADIATLAVSKLGDRDNNGVIDILEDGVGADLDNDGIVDRIDSDRDGDGMLDSWETTAGLSIYVNDASRDPDADNLTNLQEFELGDSSGSTTNADLKAAIGVATMASSNPFVADTDGDGVNDGIELNLALGITPILMGTTGSTLNLGIVSLTGGSVAAWSVHKTAGKVAYTPNPLVADMNVDTDADGLTDAQEVTAGLTTFDITFNDAGDLDGDTLTAVQELAGFAIAGADMINNGTTVVTNPLRADTDGDGLNDNVETAGFLLADGTTTVMTDPTRLDSDGDGASDFLEKSVNDANAGNAGTATSLNPTTFVVISGDTDADGKSDLEEYAKGTDPFLASSTYQYATETTQGLAMLAAGFVYVPGGWDVNQDGTVETGFWMAKYEASDAGAPATIAANVIDYLAGTVANGYADGFQVYNPASKQFDETLCTDGTDVAPGNVPVGCRHNNYIKTGNAAIAVNKVQFVNSAVPMVNESAVEAMAAIASSQIIGGVPISLPTEVQWMQAVQLLINNPASWTGGIVNSGTLWRGNSNGTAAIAANTAGATDTTENATFDVNRRTHLLSNNVMTQDFDVPVTFCAATDSNGDGTLDTVDTATQSMCTVWGMAANMLEWTRGLIAANVTASASGTSLGGDRFIDGLSAWQQYTNTTLAAKAPAWWLPTLADGTVLTSVQNVGWYYDGDNQTGVFTSLNLGYGTGQVDAFAAPFRGGSWTNGSLAGLSTARLNYGPGRRFPTIGFRAASR